MLLLFLLLIAMHIYIDAADDQSKTFPSTVTIKEVNGDNQITYKRDDFAIEFPAKLLSTSKTLVDLLTEDVCENNMQKGLKTATQYLLDDQNLDDIPLIINALEARPDISTLTNSQMNLLAHFAEFFDINHLSEGLACHFAQKPNHLATISDAPPCLEMLIKTKINFKDLGTFLYAHRRQQSKYAKDSKRKFLDFNALDIQHQAIIKKHLSQSDRYSIEVNPTNAAQILVCNVPHQQKFLILNRDTNTCHRINTYNFNLNKFSPDGTKIINKIVGDSINIFDTNNGTLIFKGRGTTNNSKNIIYGLDKDSDIWGLHLLDEKQFVPLSQDKYFYYIKFSPDDKTFAARRKFPSNCLEFYDLNQCIHGNTIIQPVFSIALPFSPDYFPIYPYTHISYNTDGSQFVVYNSRFSGCTTYDAQSKKPLGTINFISSPISKVSYTDENKLKVIDFCERAITYNNTNLAQLSLPNIGTLYKAFENWKRGQPYPIANKETLDRLSAMVPDLLNNPKLFALAQELITEKNG